MGSTPIARTIILMFKHLNPTNLAIDLLPRSICNVQVASVISDKHGIFSWGWNSSGADGFGMHAEHHAILRANKQRLKGATITVVGRRLKSKGIVMSFPCDSCLRRLVKVGIRYVVFQDKTNTFHKVEI